MPTRETWTASIGIRRLLAHLGIQMVPSLVLWLAALLIVSRMPHGMPPNTGRFGILLPSIIIVMAGVSIGWLLSMRASEAAGMASVLVTTLCFIAASGVFMVAQGMYVAMRQSGVLSAIPHMTGLSGHTLWLYTGLGAVGSMAELLWNLVADE